LWAGVRDVWFCAVIPWVGCVGRGGGVGVGVVVVGFLCVGVVGVVVGFPAGDSVLVGGLCRVVFLGGFCEECRAST